VCLLLLIFSRFFYIFFRNHSNMSRHHINIVHPPTVFSQQSVLPALIVFCRYCVTQSFSIFSRYLYPQRYKILFTYQYIPTLLNLFRLSVSLDSTVQYLLSVYVSCGKMYTFVSCIYSTLSWVELYPLILLYNNFPSYLCSLVQYLRLHICIP
jgi:hypothetical protein